MMKLSDDELNAIAKIKKENPDNYDEELKSYLFCRYVMDIVTIQRGSELIPIFYAGKDKEDFDGDLLSMPNIFNTNHVFGSFGNGQCFGISKEASDKRIKANSTFSYVTKVNKEDGIIEVLWEEGEEIILGETIELHRRPYSTEDFTEPERRKKGLVTEIIKKEFNRLLVSVVVLGREIDFEVNDIVIKSGFIPKPIGINELTCSWSHRTGKPTDLFVARWSEYVHKAMGNVKTEFIYIDKKLLPNEIKNRLKKVLQDRNISFTSTELNSYYQIIKKHGRIHKNEIKGYRDERRY